MKRQMERQMERQVDAIDPNQSCLLSSCELVLQCLRQSFLLSLAFHIHQVLSILGPRVVNTTLGLGLTLPAARAFILVLLDRGRRVVVTDALVALVQQLVVRHFVVLDVLLDLVEVPVGERVDLNEAGLVDLNDVHVSTLASLAASTSSKDCMDVEFTVSTLSRLDLGGPVV